MQGVEPAKGGRSKKGGVSEAAREIGIPRSTAKDRRKKAQYATLKVGHVKSQQIQNHNHGGEYSPPLMSNTQAAKLAGVNATTIKDAKTVQAQGTADAWVSVSLLVV